MFFECELSNNNNNQENDNNMHKALNILLTPSGRFADILSWINSMRWLKTLKYQNDAFKTVQVYNNDIVIIQI